jgi:hypothetical protein
VETNTHMRDPEVRTAAVCGQGYLWPSSISLADNPDDVTCKRCLTEWFGVEEGEDD